MDPCASPGDPLERMSYLDDTGKLRECDVDVCLANDVVRSSAVGHETTPFVSVYPQCPMLRYARTLGSPPLVVAFGASYFQRVVVATETSDAAERLGFFLHFPGTPGRSQKADDEQHMMLPDIATVPPHLATKARALALVYATCVFLAIKIFDDTYYTDTLRSLAYQALGSHERVSLDELVRIEQDVLRALDHRLGPRLFV